MTSSFTASVPAREQAVVREGLAEIEVPSSIPSDPLSESSKPQTVFYNPIQQFNRDLTVLAINAYAKDYRAWRAKTKVSFDEIKGNRGVKRKRQGTFPEVVAKSVNGVQDLPVASERVSEKASPLLIRILDALSATGLRALRYAKEVDGPVAVTANDLSPESTASIKLNVQRNQVQDQVKIATGDAKDVLNAAAASTGQAFTVVDLDPYGTAVPFLDAAVRAVVDGGLLCVTCTDAGVFASLGYSEKTFSQYGGLPMKGPAAHEGGLRLILLSIATAAARYGLSMEPLLSLSIDFYARVFVRIHRSPAAVKFLSSKSMIVYNCDSGCGSWSLQYLSQIKGRLSKRSETIYKHTPSLGPSCDTLCEHCGFKTRVAGPMWAGPLHNKNFIQEILGALPLLDREVYKTLTRVEGMLTTALDESVEEWADQDAAHELTEVDSSSLTPNDRTFRPVPPTNAHLRVTHPFYFTSPSLAHVLQCETPSDAALRGALTRLGYRTSRSHAKGGSIITNAPWNVIWEVMREWVRQRKKSPNIYKAGTAGHGIMRHDRQRRDMLDIRTTLSGALNLSSAHEVELRLEALLQRLKSGSQAGRNNHDGVTATSLTVDALDGPMIPEALPALHELEIVFDESFGKQSEKKQRDRKLVRYQQNPLPNWGPLTKARGIPSSQNNHALDTVEGSKA